MSHNRRLSQSITGGHERSRSIGNTSPIVANSIPTFAQAAPEDLEAWMGDWRQLWARDIVDSRVVTVDVNTSVEDACNILLSEDTPCLALKSTVQQSITGLFDFADVNAFLILAATKHSLSQDELLDNSRVDEIFTAARSGHVPVCLVSNLSEKNPLNILPHDATLISLLELFARGSHRVLIRSTDSSTDEFIGIVSDRSVLAWFASYAEKTKSLWAFLSNPLLSFSLPSLNLYSSVVATMSTETVLDAMKLMSEEGVSSVAVLEEETGALLSAVSVTDIGKIVVPSESNQILTTPLHQFVSFIKIPVGSEDGADQYPVYSVLTNSTLLYTMQKILATNAHRVFVSETSMGASPIMSPGFSPNLSGIVSVVDILSLFARLANVQDVDPTRMKRHRRASSVSSTRSSDREQNLSRSNSRTGRIRRASSVKNPGSRPPNADLSSNTESTHPGAAELGKN
ncbi:hypothetical protein K435DRAFT_768349 [Dendrothele bispora CBS 962.96]|uniref:CBS domain-containing protein n=1 Tax=Dendrothele bispora (strain CBS 962.96) TaxID=1314807 RepID=A0A4V4HBN0_DENBC|nr:hypothetical protein K435DRAFT_768349 [Dendrothele bispora CBS 962.96]